MTRPDEQAKERTSSGTNGFWKTWSGDRGCFNAPIDLRYFR